jgi:hypothetical protein
MRIARLAAENPRTQGPERRAWYRRHSPEHPRTVAALVEDGLRTRHTEAAPRVVVLGAGACTELPLERLARGSQSMLLVDVDVPGMARARDELPNALRPRVDLLQADLSGGVSDALAADLAAQPWDDLARLGSRAPLDAAAGCIERCPVPDPPRIPQLAAGSYDLVISSLVLTQLFSLPLLDVVDALAYHAAGVADLREAHSRYREAAQGLRRRIVLAHLALLESLLAPDGVALLMSDRTGYLLPPTSGPHLRDPREELPLLPPAVLDLPADLAARFELAGPVRNWEWLVTAPGATTPGRLYDVFGVVLRRRERGAGQDTRA